MFKELNTIDTHLRQWVIKEYVWSICTLFYSFNSKYFLWNYKIWWRNRNYFYCIEQLIEIAVFCCICINNFLSYSVLHMNQKRICNVSKLICRVDTTMLEFQSKYFPCIKQASRFAMFHCTWIEPCLAGLACTHSSLSNYIRLPHFMCCSVCRTMFDSAYTYNDKNLKLTSLLKNKF